MSTKARSVSKKAATKKQPIAAMPKPQPKPCAPIQFSAFATEWREQVNDGLSTYFTEFLKESFPEEKAFLNEAFLIWSSSHGKEVKGFADHELPFLTALSQTLNGEHLVKVDSDAMVEEVEEFITSKLEAGWKEPKRDSTPSWKIPQDVVMARVRKLLLRHVDYFTYNCRQEDMNFLIDTLEQWCVWQLNLVHFGSLFWPTLFADG